jgi:hypothetical protein
MKAVGSHQTRSPTHRPEVSQKPPDITGISCIIEHFYKPLCVVVVRVQWLGPSLAAVVRVASPASGAGR